MDLVAFFAHPDDETMLCGGTLALLASRGIRVHVLIATRGEGGEMGEPQLCTREELGVVREEELRCAVKALGASSLTLLQYVDPTVGPGDTLFSFSDDLTRLAAEISAEITRWNAGVLLTHGINGEYGHPAHIFCHQAAAAAVRGMGEQAPLFYTVQGSFPGHPHPRLANIDMPAHIVLDIAPFLPAKEEAALCHKTQHALFIRRQSEEAGRKLQVEEVIQHLESLHRVSPLLKAGEKIHDALADELRASGCASLLAGR